MNNVQCPISQFEPLVRQLPPIEDERIFKSVVANLIKEYCGLSGFTPNEISAMEWLRDKTLETYELRRRQSA